jgi:F0F1-type ATP synthase membrane subunit c/vacuolar-type H+-ATPase subunit K
METKTQSPALVMRVIRYCFLAASFAYIYVAIKIPVQPGPPPNLQFQLAIAIVGITCIIAGVLVPQLISQAAERAPQNNSAEVQRTRWITKGILRIAFFEACVLFGLVLHFLHGRVWLVELLFGAGIAAMLLWSPGTPPGTEGGEFPQS